jgi:hypothetical protein
MPEAVSEIAKKRVVYQVREEAEVTVQRNLRARF